MTKLATDSLVVEGRNVHYVIEPHRFRLGLSRVEMVDDHLAQCMLDRRHEDIDRLLDARALFGGAS